MSALVPYLNKLRDTFGHDTRLGFVQTNVNGVKFFWGTQSLERSPMGYGPGIVIIGQGRKVGYLGDNAFRYDKNTYLVVSMITPFECATIVSPNKPLLGIFIDIDLSELHELVALLSKKGVPKHLVTNSSRGVEPVPLDGEMRNAIERLLNAMASPEESEILGRSFVKEIIYRALVGKHGSALYALTQHNTHYTRIAKTISYIRQNYAKSLTVSLLAQEAGMSATAFHREFKQITGSSPLQYLKKIRLSCARSFIVHDGMRINAAATQVGYDSSSQFIREFKRFFGVTPAKAKNVGYANIDVWVK